MSDTIEGSLWKLKSSMTGASWKKHWVFTDGVKINQWHARAKPSASEAPKYSMYLKDCNVSDYQGRKYCFKIADKNSSLVLILAVDDFDSYEKWLKILIANESVGEHDHDEHADFPLSIDHEEEEHEREQSADSEENEAPQEETPPDLIFEFFRTHDAYENAANPCMPIRLLSELLPQLDHTLNVSIALRLILRDFNTSLLGVLAYSDFVSWWDGHQALSLPKKHKDDLISHDNAIEPNTIVGINSTEAVHLVGIIDPTSHATTLRTAFLTHLRLPPSDSVYDNVTIPVIEEVSDWNDAFQSTTERVDELSREFLLRTTEEVNEVEDVVEEEKEGSVDGSVYSHHTGTHTSHTHTTHNTHHTHTTHTTNNTHTTLNTHATHTTYNSHPTQVSRSTVRTIHSRATLPPSLGVSRNTVPYPDVVSRDGYILPTVPSGAQARPGVSNNSISVYDSVSGVSGVSQSHGDNSNAVGNNSLNDSRGNGGGSGGSVISQSLASHVYSETSHSKRSVRSSIHSALSHASHLFHPHTTHNTTHNTHHNTNLHTLPPLPEGSYLSDETKSERSFDTRNTEEIHQDSLNEHDEYYTGRSNSLGSVADGDVHNAHHDVDGSGDNVHTRGGVRSETEQWADMVDACVHVSAVKGAFYRTAIDGVRCIIDEYCLPDEMKTAIKLSADLVDTEGFHALNENANSTATEVYAYSGMLFSIAACPASTADAPGASHSTGGTSGTGGIGGGNGDEHAHVVFADTDPTTAHHAHTTTNHIHHTHTKHATLARQALTSASDEVQHKVAGNEVRNTDLLQATVNLLYAHRELKDRIGGSNNGNSGVGGGNVGDVSVFTENTHGNDNTTIDSYNHNLPPLPPTTIDITNNDTNTTNTMPATRPTTLLTTVVDYAGFRVTVLCPTLIDEHTTLIHGPSTIHVPTNSTTNTGSDAEATDPDTTGNSATTLHIRASSEVPPLLSTIAASLNLHIYQRPRPVSLLCLNERAENNTNTNTHATHNTSIIFTNYNNTTTNNNNTTNAAELPLIRNIDLLTTDIQVHDTPDGRLYILNLKNLLPNALPRPNSYDVQTRQLRAEYVQCIDYALKCDILQQSMQFSLNGAAPHEIDVRAERVVIQEAGYNITACRELFSMTLPHVASLLDQYASIPLDSYGLTQFLHAHGVNCRHMGVLYWLCTSSSVKSIVLSECLARCVKVVLNAQLRAHARRTKGGVLRAQHRGRSDQNDYTEYVDNANLTHRATVLELFNLVLGWGPQSDAFWSATLLDALDQKFGIQASKAHLLTQLHLPQLFIAMQYHTGTRFQDNPVYNLNTTVVVHPFNTQHILEYFIPTTKVSLHLPNEVGQLYTHADSLLLNGLYTEAASAFRFKLLLLQSMFDTNTDSSVVNVRSSPYVYQSMVAHTVYKTALCMYLSNQYVSSHHILRKYLSRSVRYSATTGRILSLLMCVCFKLGHVDKAVQYFDAAQEVYTYTLGANHPILCMHTQTLSELYSSVHANTHAHAMQLLAHVTAQKSMGEKHIITALYESRLAATYVQRNDYVTALPYLENCIEIFALATGGNFVYESSVCLYNTAICLSILGDVDRAGQLALKCVDTARGVESRKVNIYPMIVSCYTLLSDLALAKNQPHAAVSLLEQLWGVLKSVPQSFAQRKYIGEVMVVLSKRILCLLVAHMAMASRSLFDSIVSDWHRTQAALTYSVTNTNNVVQDDVSISTAGAPPLPSEVVVDVWSRACSVVYRAMIDTSPSEYFERVMQGIQENAVGNGQDLANEDASINSLCLAFSQSRTITFSAQAAVVSQLVFNAQEGASHTFIHV